MEAYYIPFKNELKENAYNEIINNTFIKELFKQDKFFIGYKKGLFNNNFTEQDFLYTDPNEYVCKVVQMSNYGCYVTLCDNEFGIMLKEQLENDEYDVYIRKIMLCTKLSSDEEEIMNFKFIKLCIDTYKK